MLEREATVLRTELARLVRGRGKRFAPELRKRVREFGQRRRAAGAKWTAIGAEIGLDDETIRRWCVDDARSAAPMRRVEIVPGASEKGRVSIVSPSGFRAEGLTVQDALTMLAALR
jgi:hypothetical protein